MKCLGEDVPEATELAILTTQAGSHVAIVLLSSDAPIAAMEIEPHDMRALIESLINAATELGLSVVRGLPN